MQNLDDDCVARLLLMAHQRLLTAHNSRHRVAALVPLELLLQVLEGHVLVPATFRYTTQILLQLLRFRYAVPILTWCSVGIDGQGIVSLNEHSQHSRVKLFGAPV